MLGLGRIGERGRAVIEGMCAESADIVQYKLKSTVDRCVLCCPSVWRARETQPLLRRIT
jgi:hypothetical protein